MKNYWLDLAKKREKIKKQKLIFEVTSTRIYIPLVNRLYPQL